MGKVNYKMSAPSLIDNGANINGDRIQDDVPETMICLVPLMISAAGIVDEIKP
ncbi:MAG: hypothetical protein L7F78_20820 [Syntrophales bacterium LBB04]|nr:hypothetical protein [Syntrophales bacterium LBB04]